MNEQTLTPEQAANQFASNPVAEGFLVATEVVATAPTDDWDQGEEIKYGWAKLLPQQSLKGTLVGRNYQKSNRLGFGDQWVYEIKTNDGFLKIGFGVAKTFIVGKLKNVAIGQIVMIKRFADVPSKKFPAKFAASYDVRLFGMDENYKELEDDNVETKTDDIPFE